MKPFFTTLIFFLSCLSSFAQPGTLDKNFGSGGIVVDSVHDAYPVHIALQSDGKSVSASSLVAVTNENPDHGFLLTRRNTDGTLDSSFGNKGSVVSGFHPSSTDRCYAVSTQPDDRIVAAGTTYTDEGRYNHVAVVRYLKDGSLDNSFGKGGLVDFSIAEKTDAFVTDMTVQKDGKVVVIGNSSTTSNKPVIAFIVRFNDDGTPDAGFGNGGVLFSSYQSIRANSVLLQPDGKIVLGASNPYSGISAFVVLRYLPDGTPDNSFGKEGEATYDFKYETLGELNSIALQTNGDIICGGTAIPIGDQFSVLVRFTTDGIADPSFGINGQVITKLSDWSEIRKVLVQPDGKILGAGTLHPGWKDQSLTVSRYFSDGTVDSSFGANGTTNTAMENGLSCSDALLQADGKILVGNVSYLTIPGINVMVFTRYNNDITRRQIIVTKIRHWLQHHGITWQGDNNVRYYTVQRSFDGGITYQPVAKLYNNHPSFIIYEDATATGDNALYRVSVVGKDSSHSLSNSLLLSDAAAVKLFPNPVRSTLQLQGLPTGSKSSVTVIDFNGNVRMSATANGGSLSINTSALKPGTYLLKVQSGNAVTTQTFVKE